MKGTAQLRTMFVGWTCIALIGAGVALAQSAAIAATTRSAAAPAAAVDLFQATFTHLGHSLLELDRLGASHAEAESIMQALQNGLAGIEPLQQAITDQENVPPPPSIRAGNQAAEATARRNVVDAARCRAAMIRGQLYHAAAMALAREDLQRHELAAKAIESFRSARQQYPLLPLACMGYVLEARTRQFLGDAATATAAATLPATSPLNMVLDRLADTNDAAAIDIRHLAMLEMLAGISSGSAEAIGALRKRGLDIVLVIDATESMRPCFDQAKQRLKDIMDAAECLAPGTGVGIVAYKDYGDDYGPTAVKFNKITRDRKVAVDFLNDIAVGGGADESEPIDEALKVATDTKGMMGWTAGRKWVIVLVGDSTIHSSGRDEAFRLARRFGVELRGTLSVVDAAGSGQQGSRREQAQGDLKTLAKESRGSAFQLREEQKFWQSLFVSIFDERFQNGLDTAIKRRDHADGRPADEAAGN